MTPDKPDIDFKLDGVKWEFIYVGRGGSSTITSGASIYCSVIPQSLYKVEGLGAQLI